MTIKLINQSNHFFQPEDFINVIISELKNRTTQDIPNSKEMLNYIVEDKKDILNKFYDINVVNKKKNFIDFILKMDYNIDDGIQTLKGIIDNIVNEAILNFEEAKKEPLLKLLTLDLDEESLLLYSSEDKVDFKIKSGWTDDDFNNIMSMDYEDSDQKFSILTEVKKLDILTYCYKIAEVYVSDSTDYGFGFPDHDIQSVIDLTGSTPCKDTEVFYANGCGDSFSFSLVRPSDHEIDLIINYLKNEFSIY